MKFEDILKQLDSGSHVLVEFNKGINEHEGRYESGQRTYLTGYTVTDKGSNYELVKFYTDEKEYKDYNVSVEQPVWYDNKTKDYTLTWSQDNPSINPNVSIYADKNGEHLEFDVVESESSKIFSVYLESGSEMSYVKWLESELGKKM